MSKKKEFNEKKTENTIIASRRLIGPDNLDIITVYDAEGMTILNMLPENFKNIFGRLPVLRKSKTYKILVFG